MLPHDKPKLSFLFWNLRGGDSDTLQRCIGRLAQIGTNVFIFAECQIPRETMVRVLNGGSTSGLHRAVPCINNRLHFYSNLPLISWFDRSLSDGDGRFIAQELTVEGIGNILIFAAHFRSATNLNENARAIFVRGAARDIVKIERDAGHERSLLVGDLNLNPFDSGLTDTDALHAVMTKELAVSARTHSIRKEFSLFYNPMWAYFGDHRLAGTAEKLSRPGGTYFYPNTGDPANTFWKVYDQLLLRPSIMNCLRNLEILTSVGADSLVTPSGRPRSDKISDHLPLFFELDFRGLSNG